MRVIGTAGHVDHGKSTLVHALTGIDPDRLREEKEREMTIDLGFAWLTLPAPREPGGQPGSALDSTVGVVDVPGHIDFIKNMLAGVGGIDAALFVVAADEGVMPQTEEHLAILDLLQVPAGVVALTKVDVITEEGWLDLVEADLQETLAGTCLANAPIVPVSARTGQGLEALKQALADVLAAAPPRRDRDQARLPIDRAFSVAGFGTVVTGTLSDGQFRVGDEVEIVPGGLRARIRSLQTHKRAVETGLPGSRLAINLTGVHPDELVRGMVVARPGALRSTGLVDVRLRLVANSAVGPLRHNQAVDFFSGAAQVAAHTRLLDAEEIPPGGSGWVQLRLESPVALVTGDRFIVRHPSPSVTVGGGQVVDPHPRRRWRRFQREVLDQLEALARGTPEDLLLHALATMEPASLKALVEGSGLAATTAEATLAGMIAKGQVLPLGVAQPPLVNSNTPALSIGGWRQLATRMADVLAEYHAQYPLRPGMAREELKSRLQGRDKWSPKLFNEFIARGIAEAVLEEAGEYLCRPGHRIVFTPEQQARVTALLDAFRRQPYTPPSMAESSAVTSPDIVSALLHQGILVRLSEDVLFLRETYDEILAGIVAFIREHGSMTVAQVRDTFNTSRKYALAVMEHLDERKVTRRQGDERVLR
ncbi:MAG: selenocysteine-specific translation elongation factor [Anaerolineae bacterium CG2_30_64_16]|nr:MAG: selenocysteine-specific translation elongation factor [Anaerolineae bacterium CG2_30_64_16]